MRDLVFVFVVTAFFVLAALFVAACERVVGSDTPLDQQSR